jgi:hypothetical protein
MAGSGKKKTTMAKLMREAKLRERRQDKAARKENRKYAMANGLIEPLVDENGIALEPTDEQIASKTVPPKLKST